MAKISDIIRPTVYVDMDGVIADFFSVYAKMAGVKTYREVPPAKVDPTLNKMVGTDVFAKLPKFNTTDKLIDMVTSKFGSYNILSSPLRGDHENSKKHKLTWLKNNLKVQPKQAIIVADKTPFATRGGLPNILIDDRGLNIQRWRDAGGFGIKYQADEDSLDVIAKGFEEYAKQHLDERFGMLGINGLAYGGFRRPLKIKKSTPGKLRYPKAKMGYSDGKGYSMNYKYKVRDVYEEDEVYDLYEFVSQSDLNQIEAYADRLFSKVGIDVEFTKHFLDRVNDERNKKPITPAELTRLFKQVYKYHAKPIAQMGPDAEAVMKDMRTDVNVPFALQWDKDNQELDLVSKTVMRKSDFKSSNRDFAVEQIILHTDPKYYGAEFPNNWQDPKGPTVDIPVDKLVGFEPEDKMKDPKSMAKVNAIAKSAQEGKPIKPILVRKYKGGFQVIDGHHRFWGQRKAGSKAVKSIVIPDSQITVQESLEEKWTKQYKAKINCNNPKGFSQKAHCAGKKKKQESVEEGVGIITPQNTTKDVKPGEVHRQANKLALKVNNQDTPMLHSEVLKDLERRWNNGKHT